MSRVLIVPDVYGWAQHRHAIGLQAYAPPECEVRIELSSALGSLSNPCIASFDAVYHLSVYSAHRHSAAKRFVGLVASDAIMFSSKDDADWRTLGVTKHRHIGLAKAMLPQWDGAVCRNQGLTRKMAPINRNAVCFPAGVDTRVFHYDPHKHPHDRLVVGWCGNTGNDDRRDCKGHKEIMQPLMEYLGDRYEWRVKTNAFDSKDALGVNAMREWYQGLDIFLCTSSADGTPNPPFEAAACGCMVISTDVGCLTDWDVIRKRGLLVPSYGNASEAKNIRSQIVTLLAKADADREWLTVNAWALMHSIQADYSYEVLAPRILDYVLTGNI